MPDELPLLDGGDAAEATSLFEKKLAGEIENVIFRSDDGSFAVVRLRDEQGREHVAVGQLGDVREGQFVECHGDWEDNPQYGRRFRTASARIVLPTSATGIRRYLASGVVPGIGPKMAERIVERFGEDTLEVIDRYSARLLEVPGFGKKRLAEVRKAWQETQDKRETVIFLQGLGIGPRHCEKIWQRYGKDAVDIVRQNPYRLADDLRGIGFKTADAIARHLDIAADDPHRLQAGVAYQLGRLTEQAGHVCYPRDALVNEAAQLLEVAPTVAAEGLERAINAGDVIAEDRDENHWIYPRFLHRDEVRVADCLTTLLGRLPETVGANELPTTDAWGDLNDAQQRAVLQAFEQPVSIITGGPGVGKTTVTREIVAVARALKLRVALGAPTGRAARRLGEACELEAHTIHRLLKWDAQKAGFYHDVERPIHADLVIVDEVSMLDISLAAHLLRAVEPGTRLVLVGDHDQLPSVGPGRFLLDLLVSRRVAVVELTEVYRQAARSRIILNAHAVNRGRMPDLQPPPEDELADFYWIEQEDPEKVTELICRLVRERIPDRFGLDPREDIQVLTPMNRGPCGADALNDRLRRLLAKDQADNVELGERNFRVGERVMQIVNNYDKGVFNGDLGQIDGIDHDEKCFIVQFDTTRAIYGFTEADQLRLAYAVTVHKSQGSEYPAVVVPVLTRHYVMLQRQLIYTAMTRARRLLVLIGSRRALEIAVRNVNSSPRHSLLASRLQEAMP